MEEEKDIRIKQIIDLEWNMMQQIENIEGQTECQTNRSYFFHYRHAQFSVWSLQMLDIYYKDIVEAINKGENLLAFKYAYMMSETDPDLFAHIANLVPDISESKNRLIEQIVSIELEWQYSVRKKMASTTHAREVTSDKNTQQETSFETYLRGELKTYSEYLLELYLENISKAKERGENLALIIAENSIKKH